MSRQAVRTGFERFVDDVVELTYEEFDVVGAIKSGASGGGSRVVSKLLKDSDALDRHVVQPMLDEHKGKIMDQFEYVLEYAASPEDEFEEYAANVLTTDLYFESLQSGLSRDRQAEIERALLSRQREFGEALRPLVHVDNDDFWPAVDEAFDQDEAERFVRDQFAFTDPLDEHRQAFSFTTGIDPADVVGGPLARGLPSVEVDYTEEAVRTLRSAESAVIDDTLDEIEKRLD